MFYVSINIFMNLQEMKMTTNMIMERVAVMIQTDAKTIRDTPSYFVFVFISLCCLFRGALTCFFLSKSLARKLILLMAKKIREFRLLIRDYYFCIYNLFIYFIPYMSDGQLVFF